MAKPLPKLFDEAGHPVEIDPIDYLDEQMLQLFRWAQRARQYSIAHKRRSIVVVLYDDGIQHRGHVTWDGRDQT